MSVNKAIILGHLGQDPEVKFLPNGNPVAAFSVATTEKWTDKNGQKQEDTQWHNIVVYGKMAENCGKYLKKGSKVFVEGKIQHRSYEGKDGQKKYVTDIVSQTIQFLDTKGSGEGRPPHPADTTNNAPADMAEGAL